MHFNAIRGGAGGYILYHCAHIRKTDGSTALTNTVLCLANGFFFIGFIQISLIQSVFCTLKKGLKRLLTVIVTDIIAKAKRKKKHWQFKTISFN